MLCLFIFIATIDAFPCSYIALTVQAAITVRCFGERKIDRVGIRCCLPEVMRSQGEHPLTRESQWLTFNRQMAKKSGNRQPSKTEYFYRQPSNERAVKFLVKILTIWFHFLNFFFQFFQVFLKQFFQTIF